MASLKWDVDCKLDIGKLEKVTNDLTSWKSNIDKLETAAIDLSKLSNEVNAAEKEIWWLG